MSSNVPRRSSVLARQPIDIGRKHRPDYWLVALTLMLLLIGIVLVYAISPALAVNSGSSSNYYVVRQLLAVGLSVIAFGFTSQIPLAKWKMAYKPLLILAGLATAAALVLPVAAQYPAHRWVRLGSLSFQSVELLKFAVLIWLAGFLAQKIKANEVAANNQKTLKILAIAVVAIGLVVAGIQSDLGSAGVLLAMMATMAYVAGLPLKRIFMIGGIIAVLGVLAISAVPYRRDRLMNYLHPAQNCQTTGWQACQALISIGSGGMIGLGLGRSVQAYGYLPEAANDSIFAVYAEKFGFIGCVILLGIFTAFFSRIKSIAERAPDDFSRLLTAGVLSWLAVQAVINIGAMIGLLPLKGITLPFISYGGTSVIFSAAAVGLVFQISRYTSHSVPKIREVKSGRTGYDNPFDGRGHRGAYHPNPSGGS